MRRSEREVKGIENIKEIMDKCMVLSLGMSMDNMPYVVPMNFGYEINGEEITIYVHCSKIGQKLDYIRSNPNVCVEMDTEHEIVSGEKACDYGFKFASVIGFGTAEILTDFDVKVKAFKALMGHQVNMPDIDFDERMINATEVIAIKLNSYTGKRRGE